MNTNATRTFASAIIPRYDVASQRAVVFFADTIPTDKVTAYVEGNGIVDFPMDSYRATQPLSDNDVKIVVEKYKAHTNIKDVQVRRRLPYTKLQRLVDKLVADPNTPNEHRQVLEVMQRSEERLSKRQIAARQRYASDGVTAALTGIKGIPNDATQDVREAAVKELSDKLAKLLMTAL